MGAHVANLRGTVLERKAWEGACNLVADREDDDATAAREALDKQVKDAALRDAADKIADMAEEEGNAGNLELQSILGAAERTILAMFKKGQDQ